MMHNLADSELFIFIASLFYDINRCKKFLVFCIATKYTSVIHFMDSLLRREYFEDVDQTWETFEKTLWGHITNFFKLSKER
jgi:hypothetical protein